MRQLIAELARAEDALRATPSRTWDLDADGGSSALQAHYFVAELHRRHIRSNQDLPALLVAEPDSVTELPHPARADDPTAGGLRTPAASPAPEPPDDGATPADGTTATDGLGQLMELLLEAA